MFNTTWSAHRLEYTTLFAADTQNCVNGYTHCVEKDLNTCMIYSNTQCVSNMKFSETPVIFPKIKWDKIMIRPLFLII